MDGYLLGMSDGLLLREIRSVKITNRHGLPMTIVNAMDRDDYSMGDARMSVTGLLKPPRIGILFKRHHEQIEKDVADNIWALFGRAIHKILEHGADEKHIPEERLYAEVRGWRISGQIDVQVLDYPSSQAHCRIIDYKSTTAYAVRQEKREWVEQLNCYAFLLRQQGWVVEELAVCAFIRDWSRHRVGTPDYPDAPTVMVPIPLWDTQTAEDFVAERVRIHQEALAQVSMGGDPPECEDHERWMRPTQYRAMKRGNKRASKVFSSPQEADSYVKEQGPSYWVETRKGEPVRCTGDYCNVSGWCRQYHDWKEQNTAGAGENDTQG